MVRRFIVPSRSLSHTHNVTKYMCAVCCDACHHISIGFFLSPVSTGDSIWTGWRTQTTSYAMSYKIHNQATALSHSHHKCVIRLVGASCGMRLRALFFVFSFFVSVCVCCLCDLLIANDAVASTQTKKEKNISFHFHLCVVLIRRMSEWASGVAGGSHLRWTEFLYIFYCNFFYCFRFVFVA